MGKLVKQLELDALVHTFSRPSPSTYPYSNFWPMFNASFFQKFLQDHLQVFTNQTICELLLTHSNYQKLWPHTNTLDPHSSLFLSHPHDSPVLQEAVTEDWPSALILSQKGWNDRVQHGVSLIRWLIMSTSQTKNKSQWSLKLTKFPKWHPVISLAPIFSKLQDHQIPELQLHDHPFREFFIGGV